MCRYGFNGVCASLPLDGVNAGDYEAHVTKYHVNGAASVQEDVKQLPWNPYLAAQNLPAVLNDPSKGKQSNFFTKKWGDSFVEKTPIGSSPHLQPVTWADFEVYLKRIGRRYKRHQRMEESLRERTQQNSSQRPQGGYTEDIPGIFLKPQLQLSEPETFAQVFPGKSVFHFSVVPEFQFSTFRHQRRGGGATATAVGETTPGEA